MLGDDKDDNSSQEDSVSDNDNINSTINPRKELLALCTLSYQQQRLLFSIEMLISISAREA